VWQIVNRTPFAAAQSWVRDRNGAEVWLVAIKCTFDITPDGSTVISSEQPPVLRIPEYCGEPGKSSLRFESDLVLTKATTDVVVLGHACAPEGIPVAELDVGLRIGAMQKSLRVFGDRVWTANGPSRAQPFTKMPLMYERAFGGVDRKATDPGRAWDWRNPVGTGFATSNLNVVGMSLPNFEYPDQLVSTWDNRPAPAGLGPIASFWQPRAAFAGTYDSTWENTRQPLLPQDFDERFFQCAPIDQQTPAFLSGGERVVLVNLSRIGQTRFQLPEIELDLVTKFMDGERRFHEPPKLHTVILQPDIPRVSLVWHSALECHAHVYKLEQTRIELRRPDGADDEALDDLLDLV
jgi:hypothetical protein